MHLSSRIDGAQTGTWCLAIMGFTSSGRVAINSWSGSSIVSTWTHVAATHSSTNSIRLYINGALSGAYEFSAAGARMTITLGSSLFGTACNASSIQIGQYSGSLDEFQVYARELTAAEISTLANP